MARDGVKKGPDGGADHSVTVRAVRYHRLGDRPVPTWGAEISSETDPPSCLDPGPMLDLMANGGAAFRGVSIDRLPAILATGIDVHPTDATIYVGDLDKAWEYGNFPKVVLALNWASLSHTHRQIRADTPAEHIAELRKTYPHEYTVEDQTWLSRINDPNPARRNYEPAYARWMPGDPFEALLAVFVYGTAGDLERAKAQLR